MLVSSLRNIGLATMQNKDEIDVILEQQWNDIKKSKKILICNLDLDSRSLSLESIDNSLDNLRKVLPGLTSGSSQNFSPFVRIYHSVSQDDNRFFSLKPSTIVKFEKTSSFENSQSTEEIASKFGIWLKRNKEILQENILKHFEEYYLTKSNKDELVIMKDAPLYLSFKIKTREGFRYIGDIPDFERMYLSRKHASQNSAKIKNNLP
ncbi:MAG: hypothetical protein KAU62_09160, partial [Candidatus Heimdallarchaeota archaeon]|nr:hypothetical protein [Candidatus Heimdallarchaeota archaeon]MCK4611308.1 hypothetical protein [Candidatus Heimdallarchaeota archaeon]